MVNKLENDFDSEGSTKEVEMENIPEWLTEELFREFLEQDFPNFTKISKFSVKPAVAAGENYMTIMLRVTITVDMSDSSSNTTSYMVKIKPSVEKFQIMIKEWQIFLKEHSTYSKYIPIFEQYYQRVGRKVQLAPRLLEPRKVQVKDDLLILEDLRLKGFSNNNRHTGLDMVHTKAVLRKLAQFHAVSAQYVQAEGPFPEVYDRCFTCTKDLFGGHRLRISKLFREHLHLYGDVEYLEEKLVSLKG